MRYIEGMDMPGVSDLHQREVTRDQGPIRALVYFTLNRNLSANIRRARLFGYSLRLAYSGGPAGFIITVAVFTKLGFSTVHSKVYLLHVFFPAISMRK